MEPLIIADTRVEPGTRQTIQLPVANLYTHTRMDLPVHVVHGKKPGPILFVNAAIHGDELNGVEIIRRLLKHKALSSLSGSLIAIPIVNMFGLIQQSRYLPDRRDLNRSFPGSSKGPLASRLANIFLNSIVRHADYGIDIHTGALHRSNLPQIRANLDDTVTHELAVAFGVPVIINAIERDGSLREAATSYGVKTLLYEAGEALRFDELAIKAGLRGVINVMRHLRMLKPGKSRKPVTEPYMARTRVWVRAPHSGVFINYKKLGDRVSKGEQLGCVSDPTDLFNNVEFPVNAVKTGIIIGKSNLPLVNEGDAIYHIASFEDSHEVAHELETFQQDFDAG